jgi:ATP/maltotriose-dependent transcriptional regulator MalT
MPPFSFCALITLLPDIMDTQDMIFKLENDNLSIILLDKLQGWYRYEHIFTELLHN